MAHRHPPETATGFVTASAHMAPRGGLRGGALLVALGVLLVILLVVVLLNIAGQVWVSEVERNLATPSFQGVPPVSSATPHAGATPAPGR